MKPTIGQIALGAGAAWVLYRWMTGQALLPDLGFETDTDEKGVNNPANGGVTTGSPDIKQLLSQAVIAAQGTLPQLMTFDEWNYYYVPIRGMEPPKGFEESGLTSRTARITIDEYLGYAGLKGLGGIGYLNLGPAYRGWNIANSAVLNTTESMNKVVM